MLRNTVETAKYLISGGQFYATTPPVVECRWKVNVRLVHWEMCKYQHISGSCRGLVMPGANTWLYAPYQNLLLRNVRNTSTAKLPAQTFATCKRIAPQKRRLKWELRSEKSYTSLVRTTLRNNSKAFERSKTYVQRHRFLQWRFWREKSVVQFRKNAGALLKNTVRFQTYRTWLVLTAPNGVISEKFTISFCSFLPLKAKNLSPKSSRVI